MSQNQEVWIIAEFSNDLAFGKELYMHLNISGNPCIMSTSDEGFASEAKGNVICNIDPIIAFQEMLGSLDKSCNYKLVIVSHGVVLNGRHAFSTSLPEGSEHVSVDIDSADLLNSLNRDFNILETLIVSCYGGAVHKDLDPSPSKIYTIADPESPCVICDDMLMPGIIIRSIQDVVLNIVKVTIFKGLIVQESLEEEEVEVDGPDTPLVLSTHDNCIFHSPYIMMSQEEKAFLFDSVLISGDATEPALRIIPEICRYEGFDLDLSSYCTKGTIPNLEGKIFSFEIFPLLRIYNCVSGDIKKELEDQQVGDLCNGYGVKFKTDMSVRDLVFGSESRLFTERLGFNVFKIGLEGIDISLSDDTEVAMDFFLDDSGGYKFDIYFFPLVPSATKVALMFSKHVGQEFKDSFYGDETLQNLMARESELTEQEAVIFRMLEASRFKMKVANQSSKAEFASAAEAYAISELKKTLFDIDLGISSPEALPGEISFACLRPNKLDDITYGQDIYKVDAQEWVFGQLSGRAVELMDSLI